MIIVDEQDVPASKEQTNTQIDYERIAKVFNKMRPGQAMKLPKVYNITSFRRNLARRAPPSAFEAYHREGHCYVKRLSEVGMEEW